MSYFRAPYYNVPYISDPTQVMGDNWGGMSEWDVPIVPSGSIGTGSFGGDIWDYGTSGTIGGASGGMIDPTLIPQSPMTGIPTEGYDQGHIDQVVELLNTGQATPEEVGAYFGVDPSVVQENLDYINRTHHTPTPTPTPTTTPDPVVTDDPSQNVGGSGMSYEDIINHPNVTRIPSPNASQAGTGLPGQVISSDGAGNATVQYGQDPGAIGNNGVGSGNNGTGNTGNTGGNGDSGGTGNGSGSGSTPDGSGPPQGPPTGSDGGSNDGGDNDFFNWLPGFLGGLGNIIPGIDPTNFGGDDVSDWTDILDGWFGGGQGGQGGSAIANALGGTVSNIIENNIYERAADEQQDINRDAAIYGFGLSNPDQYGPYGNVIWENRPPGSPAPRVRTTLTPEQQALFDANQARQTGMAQLAGDQLGRVGSQFGSEFNPALTDFYNVTGEGVMDYLDPGQLGHDQTFQALQALDAPYRQQEQQALNADLAARGFNPETQGSQFAQMQLADQHGRRDLQNRLAAQEMHRGMVADTARTRGQQVDERLQFGRHQGDQRAREFQEALTRRGLPLNELNALATGSQFSMPQFQGFTGTNVQPANAITPAMGQAKMFGGIGEGFWGAWGKSNQSTSANKGTLWDNIHRAGWDVKPTNPWS